MCEAESGKCCGRSSPDFVKVVSYYLSQNMARHVLKFFILTDDKTLSNIEKAQKDVKKTTSGLEGKTSKMTNAFGYSYGTVKSKQNKPTAQQQQIFLTPPKEKVSHNSNTVIFTVRL